MNIQTNAHRHGNSIDRVYVELKRLVTTYETPPGHHIHIQDIAQKLNTSPTPVREALNRLLNEGLVLRKFGRGFYNKDINIKELSNLFQIRGALVISALFMTPMAALRKSINGARRNDDSADARHLSDVDACQRLIRATDNAEIQRTYNSVLDKTASIWNSYASSEKGRVNIQLYNADIRAHLLEENLLACVRTIQDNTMLHIRSLDDLVRDVFGKIRHDASLIAQRELQ
jgi:DNA-binding GntR family transcriptional regulator